MDIARSTRLASEASHARVDLVSKQAIKPNITAAPEASRSGAPEKRCRVPFVRHDSNIFAG